MTGINDTGGKCYTGDKLYWWQRSAFAAKLSPAAKVGHGHRYCHWNSHENAQRHLTYPDQRPRRPPKLLQTKTAVFSLAASGASDQDVWVDFGCNFSWRFQWHHRRPWPTSAAGDIADLSPSTFSYPWQLPTSMASLFLWPAINLSPVSLTPAIIVHRCRCHRRQSYRRCRCHQR